MRAVVKNAAERGVTYITDAGDPKATEGTVVIEVGAASLCGTDRELYEWTPSAQAFNLNLPVTLGHEGAGAIVEVGPGVTGLQVGDQVALESHLTCGQCFPCRTGDAHTCERTGILGMHIDGVFAQYAAIPQDICVKLPTGLSLESGALLEAAGVAVHAIQRANYSVAGRAVLVSGAGPVGLVVVNLALLMGASHVIAVDPNPYRRAQAEKLGATALHPNDRIVERCRELTGRRLWETWEQSLLLLDSGKLELDWLITHRKKLSDIDEAVELLTGDACRVLLIPGLG
jgi:threonine 3-dehydrogenase